jgi:hypothetical protein
MTPAAPVNSKPAASATDVKAIPATSTPYDEEEEASTPAGPVPTSALDVCHQEIITVTATDVTTITVYPSDVNVKPVLTSTTSLSSTEGKPTAAGQHRKGRHNSTFSGYSTGMAYPSGFAKLPKTW